MSLGALTTATKAASYWAGGQDSPPSTIYYACGVGSLSGWAGRDSAPGRVGKDASCRSRGHSMAGLGTGTPGRCQRCADI